MTYELLWRNKHIGVAATTLAELISALRLAADHLQTMVDNDVTLSNATSSNDDFFYLVTHDPYVAKTFGFEAVDWGDEDAGDEDSESGLETVTSQ